MPTALEASSARLRRSNAKPEEQVVHLRAPTGPSVSMAQRRQIARRRLRVALHGRRHDLDRDRR
jgi:hypothetical protein